MRGSAWLVAWLIAVVVALALHCGGEQGGGGGDASPVSDDSPLDDGSFLGDDGSAALTIDPPDAVVDVTFGQAPQTLQYTARLGGVSVTASFSVDRGEIASIDSATGLLTPTGTLGGKATVTAKAQGKTASTSVTVRLHMSENGAPSAGDAGSGGIGGVGGEGPGGSVSGQLQGVLTGPATADPALTWLYPYDATVWPRGLLAPLLQWTAGSHSFDAVYIHIAENAFDYQGFFAKTATPFIHHPVTQTAWKTMAYSNGGEDVTITLVFADGGKAYGPITESWKIAGGTLKGTIYYESFYSQVLGNQAGILSIKPGAASPSLALPGQQNACVVCHMVSADGSTLVSNQDQPRPGYVSSSYDLTKGGTLTKTYLGSAPDGTDNVNKFSYAALYPDGSLSFADARYGPAFYASDSALFRMSDGNQVATTGLSGVVASAVAPMFSPDGRRIAFNFWEGAGAGGVSAGAGHNLVVMDFACGQADGGVGCGSPPYAFSNLRQIYSDANRWPAWSAFLPDGGSLVFHDTVVPGNCESNPGYDAVATWCDAQAELWWSDVPPNAQTPAHPARMDAINGIGQNAKSYLPTSADHPDDTKLNYEPTVVPIASGGYAWVVFTSRRIYGNVITTPPYDNGYYDSKPPPYTKKLWVAAIDLGAKPGKDPSHPAFYLPGQEIAAENDRGYWVPEPCRQNGTSCVTGDECCGGYCHMVDGGLTCSDQPQGCSQEYDKCTTSADCCGASAGYQCIGGRCAQPPR